MTLKMQAGQITAPRRIEFVEVPIPQIQTGEMLIQLEVGSICGSDLPYFLFDTSHPALEGVTAPLPPMLSLHELIGTVSHSKSRRFKEGDRVQALPALHHGGLAEYFVSSEDRAIHLPAGPGKHLVVSQPLGTVIHACQKLPELIGQTAVVVGQGPIGQLFTAMLRHLGIAKLIAVDVLPERLKVSTRMGATHTVCGSDSEVVHAVEEITEGKRVDLSVEAVGKPDALNLAARLIRRNGTLIAFGVPHKRIYDFALHEFFWNEGRLICSLGPTPDDFRMAVDLISSGSIDVSPLVTHEFPFRQAQQAFTTFADRADGALKVVLSV